MLYCFPGNLARMFQSPPPRRGRPTLLSCRTPGKWFQSPPPRRGRPWMFRPFDSPICFNPRPRAGGDAVHQCPGGNHPGVSIPAPAQGATRIPHNVACLQNVSIPAPAQGATYPQYIIYRDGIVSIPAPAQGATTDTFTTCDSAEPFQSPPPRRGRPRPTPGGDSAGMVSIPAPAQGATTANSSVSPIAEFQSPPPRRGRPR